MGHLGKLTYSTNTKTAHDCRKLVVQTKFSQNRPLGHYRRLLPFLLQPKKVKQKSRLQEILNLSTFMNRTANKKIKKIKLNNKYIYMHIYASHVTCYLPPVTCHAYFLSLFFLILFWNIYFFF